MKRILTRLYDRDPRAYLKVGIALIAGEVLLLCVPLGVFIGARYLGLSGDKYLLTTAIVDAAAIPVQVVAVLVVGSDIRLMVHWAMDHDPNVAGDVIRTIHSLPRRAVVRVALLYAVVFVPIVIGVFSLVLHHLGLREAAVLTLGTVVIVAFGAQLTWYSIELLTGPVVADVTAHVPEANRVAARSIPVTLRLLLSVFMAAVGGGVIVSTIDAKFGEGAGSALKMLAVSLGVAVTFGILWLVAAVFTVLEPTRDLIRGAKAVRRGDLDVQVPISSADDLGELAESFNDMVRGLRERERLRSRNEELIDELRASRERIVAAADASRRNVERDLHDGAQQRLVLLALKARLLEREQGTSPLVSEIRDDIEQALGELRDLAHGLYPQLLASDGLRAALSEAARSSALPTTVDCDGAGRYRPELEAAVYFCCLEALQNAAKHAGEGAHVTLSLAQHEGALAFTVSDDGHGFDPRAIGASTGLQNMTDRIGALGGELRIDSSPGHGTTVMGAIPTGEKH